MIRSRVKLMLLFIVLPIVLVTYPSILFYQTYNLATRPLIRPSLFYSGEHAPPGLTKINVVFSKTDFLDDFYRLDFDVKVYSNQSSRFSFAVYNKEYDTYQTGTLSLFSNESDWLKFETPEFEAFYYSWWSSLSHLMRLEVFNPQNFPLDVYETPMIILSFNNTFYLDSFELSSKIPSQFVASLKNFKTLSYDEIPQQLKVDMDFVKGSAVRFKIALIREHNQMILLFLYSLIPSLSLYLVAILSELTIEGIEDRLKIYVGSMFALFSYLWSFRQFAPPTITWLETILVFGILLWIIESAVRYFQTGTKDS